MPRHQITIPESELVACAALASRYKRAASKLSAARREFAGLQPELAEAISRLDAAGYRARPIARALGIPVHAVHRHLAPRQPAVHMDRAEQIPDEGDRATEPVSGPEIAAPPAVDPEPRSEPSPAEPPAQASPADPPATPRLQQRPLFG